MRHAFEAHSSSPNFSFTCGIDGCPQTFSTFSAITSHFRRKHRGTSAALSSSEPQCFQSSESEGIVTNEESLPGLASSQEDRVQRSAALFLLTLKERYEITQTALDFAVGQVHQMVTYIVEDIQASVEEHLRANGTPLIDMPAISECFQVPDPFCDLQTEHMQSKYYKENFFLVVNCIFP